MFIDWLTVFQDFDFDLPYIAGQKEIIIDTDTSEILTEKQPAVKYEGSYSTSLSVRISGRRLTVKGNPSRINRLDNLFGFTSLDDCIRTYNNVLRTIFAPLCQDPNIKGKFLSVIPQFTKCTRKDYATGTAKDGNSARTHSVSDGATIQEIHITTNKSVGRGNVLDYIRGLSTQRYRNSIPRLHANGATLDWLSKQGNAPLIYADVYDKANELDLHQLRKILRKYGNTSPEYLYLLKVKNFCIEQGVARFEQKLKSRFLRRNDLCFWGLSDFSKLEKLHREFINIDQALKVDAMTFQSISDQLMSEGICHSRKAANSTASVFYEWLNGQIFDLSKSQIKVHRARLRKLHIDIAERCDHSKISPVKLKETREIEVSELAVPDWYQRPQTQQLQLVA